MSTKAQLIAKLGAGCVALLVPCVMYYEGRVLKSYRDPVGIWTACDGHTGPDVRPGQTYTQAQCDELLATDLMKHDAGIGKCVSVDRLEDGPRAAFVSFAFNVGAKRFCESGIARLVRAGDVPKACAELTKWVYAGGRVLPGLVKRRARERAICEGRA